MTTNTATRQRKRLGLAGKVMRWVEQHGKQKRAIPLLASLAVGDFFVPALPTQSSVLALGVLQPKRAPFIALSFALAGAIGTAILALLTLVIAELPVSSGSDQWQSMQRWVQQYGIWVLLAASMLPTPPRTAVIVCLLSGVSSTAAVTTVFAGKLIWYTLVMTIVLLLRPNLAKLGSWYRRKRETKQQLVNRTNNSS